MKPLSNVARKTLARAASREGGNVCPIVEGRIHAATEMAVIGALFRRGFITDTRQPYITDAGHAHLKEQN